MTKLDPTSGYARAPASALGKTDDHFRWTRNTYRHAHRLFRILDRYLSDPDPRHAIVRQYIQLWERHPQFDDMMGLSTPRERYERRFFDMPF